MTRTILGFFAFVALASCGPRSAAPAARDAALRRVLRAQPEFAAARPQERAARLAALAGVSVEEAQRLLDAGGAIRGAAFIQVIQTAQRVHAALERGNR